MALRSRRSRVLWRLVIGGMKMRRSKLALLGVAALAAVALFPTAAVADDWDDCGKQSGDLAIAACSRAIDSGRYTGQSLARLYTARGVAYQAKGDLDRAMADFNESMQADLTYARAYTTRGITWYRKGDLDRAMADFDEAIRLDPKGALHYSNRGIDDYNEAIRLDPKDDKAYYNRGVARGLKGDLDRAIAEYNEAIRLNPN